MEQVVVDNPNPNKEETPAVARMYATRVLKTKFPQMSKRDELDIDAYSTALDHLTEGKCEEAADVMATQLTAAEAKLVTGKVSGADHLRLTDGMPTALVGREEQHLMMEEEKADQELKGKGGHWNQQQWGKGSWQGGYNWNKGNWQKGGWKGDKDGKGKWTGDWYNRWEQPRGWGWGKNNRYQNWTWTKGDQAEGAAQKGKDKGDKGDKGKGDKGSRRWW